MLDSSTYSKIFD